LKFLELPAHDLLNYDRIHETKYLPQTAMKPETRMRLEEFYRPYNRQLKDLLGSEWDAVWESG
jgi:N-formylglutamate amidohydrolase